MTTNKQWLVVAALVSGMVGAQAALIDRGDGLVYDSTQDITWLANWNYARLTGFDADGLMTWATARNHIAGLNYAGHSDWRLPTVVQPDASCANRQILNGGTVYDGGTGCTGSEVGHLFYVDLGGTANVHLVNQTGETAQQLANQALFVGTPEFGAYFSGTDYAGDAGFAWAFRLDGIQGVTGKSGLAYAIAVHDGDVAAPAAVPEPQSMALAMLGLGLLGLTRRRAAVRPRRGA